MSRSRLNSEERRAQIIAAARTIFSKNGYNGAKTLQIAQAAKVSEALVYRHFPSKLALYRAVMRQVFREQDAQLEHYALDEVNAAALITSIKNFFHVTISEARKPEAMDRHRMTLASLASNGSYAALIYRRSQKRSTKGLEMAHRAARSSGDMTGKALDVQTTAMFIEHVGTMLGAIGGLDFPVSPYGVEGEELARQATWFCCRGLGFKDEVIARHLGD